MGALTERHRRRWTPRGRMGLVTAAALMVIPLIFLPGAARLYTTYLWFGEVHLTSVWVGMLGAELALASVFTAFFSWPCG